jgi:hypothetical protein
MRHIAKLQGFDRKKGSAQRQPAAIFPISVKQKYHEESDQVRAIFEEACAHFDTIYIPIGDYIYRHTLQIERQNTVELATQEAEQIGIKWEEEHKFIEDIASAKGVTLHFIHWKEEFDEPMRVESSQIIENLYKNNSEINRLIDLTAHLFATNCHKESLEKTGSTANLVSINEAAKLCLDYIKEELSIFLFWRKKYNTKDFFYPFEHNAVSKYIREALTLIFKQKEVKTMFEDIEENSLDLHNISVVPAHGKKDKKQPSMFFISRPPAVNDGAMLQENERSRSSSRSPSPMSEVDITPPGSPPKLESPMSPKQENKSDGRYLYMIFNQLRQEASQGHMPSETDLNIAAQLVHKLQALEKQQQSIGAFQVGSGNNVVQFASTSPRYGQ